MRFLSSLLFFSIVFSSCKKDEDQVILYGYECFPMEEGRYVIYDVVDVFHDIALFPAHDTSYYQIKEVIGEEEVDNLDEPYRKLRRYYRENDTMPWLVQDVWTIKRLQTRAETVEENKRRISLAFSISYDQFWNYNAFNEDPALEAYYDDIYLPSSFNGITYDSTVTVEIENTLTYIDYRRQYDIYATGIGRIYSCRKDLQINNTDTLNIHKGTEVFYTAVETGVE
jgi:hypothetical protein